MENKTEHPCTSCRSRVYNYRIHCPRFKRTIEIDICRGFMKYPRSVAWRVLEKAQQYIE